MGLFHWLGSIFDVANDITSKAKSTLFESLGWSDEIVINPASGLLMPNSCSGIDVAGNPYGFDFTDDGFDMSNSSFGSSVDSWND